MILGLVRPVVFEANLELVQCGLVLYAFGNSSGIDREPSLAIAIAKLSLWLPAALLGV